MKKFLILAFIFLSIRPVMAQQTTIDNALLLDYYQSQKYGDAYKYLKQAYQEPIADNKVLQNLAYTAQMSGNLADAENYYLRIYDKDSTNVGILFNLGGINVRRKNNLKAIVYYKKILQRDSLNFNVYKQLADLSITDSANYINYLVKANSINPIDPDVAYELDLRYVLMKDYAKAGVVIDKALKADSANLLLLKGKAQVLFMQLNYRTTIDVCNKLVQAGDKATAIVNWLAISYYKMRQYKLCINSFQLLGDGLQNEGTFFYTAMSYKALDDNQNAIVYFLRALKDAISPNVPDYYMDLGDSYDSLHQQKKAIAAYQKSLQFKESPLTYYSLANLYDVELKDKKTALKYYKKYLASNPSPTDEKKYIDYAKARIPDLGTK